MAFALPAPTEIFLCDSVAIRWLIAFALLVLAHRVCVPCPSRNNRTCRKKPNASSASSAPVRATMEERKGQGTPSLSHPLGTKDYTEDDDFFFFFVIGTFIFTAEATVVVSGGSTSSSG